MNTEEMTSMRGHDDTCRSGIPQYRLRRLKNQLLISISKFIMGGE